PSFGKLMLADIEAEAIEAHLRLRLKQKRKVRRSKEVVELGPIKPATAHQEFRVLGRILNVAVKKNMLLANAWSGVEFSVIIKSLFRPHYMTWSEQQKIEAVAPAYLKNVIRIITETGLRVYKELACMKKDHVDLANKVVFIADSKTPTGVAEVPLTDIAVEAFRNQVGLAGPGQWLFPSSHKPNEHQTDFKKTWRRTLKRAEVPYFRLYDLRSTFATRLSAG